MESPPKILERSRKPAPFWQVSRRFPPRQVNADMSCKTLVVGAGITGLSIAKALSRSQSVIVLDAGQIGESSSGWNAGILSLDTTVDLREVEENFGEAKTKALVASLRAALEETRESLQLKDDIWQSGNSLYLAARESHQTHLQDELTIRQKYDLPTKMLDAQELSATWPGFASAMQMGHEQAVHPVKLLLAMAGAIFDQGSHVFEDSPVHSWEHVGDRFVVRCGAGFVINAENLVLCTGMNSADFAESSDLDRLLVPVVGHVFVTEPSAHFAELLSKGGPIALWDSLQLYHYVRYLPDGRLLVGGEEIPGTVPGTVLSASDPHIQKLYRWAQEHHSVKLPPIAHCWKATLVLPADGLPLIKVRRLQDNFLISAVTDGLPSGMLLGTTVAQIINSGTVEVAEMLSNKRHLVLTAKLLKALPALKPLRKLAFRLVFAALRLRDKIL